MKNIFWSILVVVISSVIVILYYIGSLLLQIESPPILGIISLVLGFLTSLVVFPTVLNQITWLK